MKTIASIINKYSRTIISIENIDEVEQVNSKLEIIENAYCIDVCQIPIAFNDEKSILSFINDWNTKQIGDEDFLIFASQIYRTNYCNFDGVAFSPSQNEFSKLKKFKSTIESMLESYKN